MLRKQIITKEIPHSHKELWIKKLKEIHSSKGGGELTDDEAAALFEHLIAFVESIYGNK
jgi:hypothetical protein